DRKILNCIQEEFPLVSKPYDTIGARVGLNGFETFERVKRLRKNGVIRRIGAILERKKLGYSGILCGVHVNEENVDAFVDDINKEEGVTHNYEREGELNIWFTVIKQHMEEIDAFITALEEKFRIVIYRFPEKQTFKIRTFFPV
ncbi:MAG TPA: Lrp/AsnC family transcriptional regulator, partial [Syntrophorhabdaceae bacterium]|nr:Lrp/AsnC family transcriptional regulator [Syntrophorhabdaceae bacterium]